MSPSHSATTEQRPTVTAHLKDGRHVRLRPVTPDDKSLLAEGFSRLSARARYLRFLVPSDRLSPGQLAYLSEVDHREHVAWGALDDTTAAGVGRWVRYPDDRSAADVGLTVLDDYQRRGLGRLLLEVLAVSARARGVAVFHFDVLAENEAMTGLLRSLGARPTAENGVVHFVLDVSRVAPPSIVSGDVIAVLEAAARTAETDLSPDRARD